MAFLCSIDLLLLVPGSRQLWGTEVLRVLKNRASTTKIKINEASPGLAKVSLTSLPMILVHHQGVIPAFIPYLK
jgi:hypothetical protein